MLFFLTLALLIGVYVYVVGKKVLPRHRVSDTGKKIKCLVVLGSGGHTSEMLGSLRSLSWKQYDPTYVIAATDKGSQAAMMEFEADNKTADDSPPKVLIIPRAREVGQSYVSSIGTTLYAFLFSARVVLQVNPELILTNGPGTCVPICVFAFALRFVGFRIRIAYFESFTCVHHLSVSGKILYKIADVFTVQWKQLLSHYPKAVYAGPDLERLTALPKRTDFSKNYVLVTVGSTHFDPLIEACDTDWFVQLMKERFNIPNVRMQIGTGKYEPTKAEYLRFKQQGFAKDIAEAALVIGHAGAGSILDAMKGCTPMIVVPNETLMNNHQQQLCDALVEVGLVKSIRLNELKDKLPSVNLSDLKMYPKAVSPVLRKCLES